MRVGNIVLNENHRAGDIGDVVGLADLLCGLGLRWAELEVTLGVMSNDKLHTAGAEAAFPIEYHDSMAAGHGDHHNASSFACESLQVRHRLRRFSNTSCYSYFFTTMSCLTDLSLQHITH